MCGIFGYINFTKNIFLPQEEILKSLSHRGPDHSGYFCENNVALFHTRLSIIDLDLRSHQPFHDDSGRYVLVFNGEIYNYSKLKSEIDFDWRTSSDTELLLVWLIKFGVDRLNDLEGMFAFAFYDRIKKELIISRDKFGEKPLYYYIDQDVFCFSSEIRSILKAFPRLRNTNKEKLFQWFTWQTIPHGTIIEGIEKVNRGETLIVHQSGKLSSEIRPSLNLLASNEVCLSNNVNDNIRQLVTAAIRKCLICDVPFASFLSGGIDSSIVAAVASKYYIGKLNTFSVVFEEDKFNEGSIASLVSKRFNTNHTELLLTSKLFLESLPSALNSTDHPSADGLNTYIVSKGVRDAGYKMALSGLGGDELFLGYPYARRLLFLKNFTILGSILPYFRFFLPYNFRKLITTIEHAAKYGGQSFSQQRVVFDQKEIRSFFGFKESKPDTLYKGLEYSQNVFLNQEWDYYTEPVLLRDTDQYSMAVGLEVRSPFIDSNLISYLSTLPMHYFTKGLPKQLLIDSFLDELPRQVYDRKKQGFTLPWEIWMKSDLKDFCTIRINSFCNRIGNDSLCTHWSKFEIGKTNISWAKFWAIVALEDWLARNSVEVLD